MNENRKILKRQLIADQKNIELQKSQLQLIEKDLDNWTETYLDRNTGDKWLLYRVFGEMQGAGYQILGRLPFPDTNQLIELALLAENEDEISAACWTLIENEGTKNIDFRENLINRLESIQDTVRLKEVIKLTRLNSPLNRREILGKTMVQISLDAQFYKNIAERAAEMMRK
jgi:hypothetical protein